MVRLFYQRWWKVLAVIVLLFVVVAGLLVPMRTPGDGRAWTFPDLPILRESIRNTFFHIPMWFGMIALLLISLIYSIRYLGSSALRDDRVAYTFSHAGIAMGFLGLATGTVWAVYTWAHGDWSNTGWIRDPKILGASLTILVYLAYFILRGSLTDPEKRARLAAVYNIFGFAMAIVFIFVMPRLPNVDSLHPGNGGNPAFSDYDLDGHMRVVFFPAVLAWTLIGFWLASLRFRILELKTQHAS
jgi:heme exporter protein C